MDIKNKDVSKEDEDFEKLKELLSFRKIYIKHIIINILTSILWLIILIKNANSDIWLLAPIVLFTAYIMYRTVSLISSYRRYSATMNVITFIKSVADEYDPKKTTEKNPK